MIAKQVLMTQKKGSGGGKAFGRLINYITNRDEQERGPLLLSDNLCNAEMAVLEIERTDPIHVAKGRDGVRDTSSVEIVRPTQDETAETLGGLEASASERPTPDVDVELRRQEGNRIDKVKGRDDPKAALSAVEESKNSDGDERRGDREDDPAFDPDGIFQTETAALEMESAALMSPRTKQPALHIVLSWQQGEHPTEDQQREAVKVVLASLKDRDGRDMSDHQWAAVLHKDTNNDHLHLVINRVNPDTGRAVSPEWSHRSLAKAIREIEAQQGWKIDNGFEHGERLPVRAAEMEAHQNVESVVSYIREQKIEQKLRAVLAREQSTWSDIHRVLAEHGLKLNKAEKGGYTVQSGETHVKASNGLRGIFSGKEARAKLEGLGEWQAYHGDTTPNVEYNPHSEPRRNNEAIRAEQREARAKARKDLWERYQAARTEHKRLHPVPTKEKMRDLFKPLRQAGAEERKKVRQATSPWSKERIVGLSIAAFKTVEHIDHIKADLAVKRQAAHFPSYQEWVANRANDGDRAAQAQMRGWKYAKARMTEEQRQKFEKNETRLPIANSGLTNGVTWQRHWLRKGVVYSINGEAALIDKGTNIKILKGRKASDQSIALTMSLIAQKQGGKVDMRGDKAFKERCIAVAVEHKINVTFFDKEMQTAFEAARGQQRGANPSGSTLRPSVEAILTIQRQNAALIHKANEGYGYER